MRPKGPRTLKVELKAPPRTKNYMLVGVAFDYLFRFEMQRLNPSVIARKWVAEHSLARVRWESPTGSLVVAPPVMMQGSIDLSQSIDPRGAIGGTRKRLRRCEESIVGLHPGPLPKSINTD